MFPSLEELPVSPSESVLLSGSLLSLHDVCLPDGALQSDGKLIAGTYLASQVLLNHSCRDLP